MDLGLDISVELLYNFICIQAFTSGIRCRKVYFESRISGHVGGELHVSEIIGPGSGDILVLSVHVQGVTGINLDIVAIINVNHLAWELGFLYGKLQIVRVQARVLKVLNNVRHRNVCSLLIGYDTDNLGRDLFGGCAFV